MKEQMIEELYKQYGPMVHRRCLFILKDEEKAFDIMQDVFVKLLTKFTLFNVESKSAYLYRMATNMSLNLLKKNSRMVVDSELFNTMVYEDNIEAKTFDKMTLEKIFSRVHELTRVIAVLKYHQKLKYNEISEIVGLSVSAVRKRLRVLRKKALELKESVK